MAGYGGTDCIPQGLTLSAGRYTVVADDDTANTVGLATGLGVIVSHVVQVLRAGIPILGDGLVTTTGGTIALSDGATYVLTTGDVINWIAVGTK